MRRLSWAGALLLVGLGLFFLLRSPAPAPAPTPAATSTEPLAAPHAPGALTGPAGDGPQRTSAPPAAGATLPARSGAIRGRVLDPAGRPVEGATVAFHRRDDAAAFAFAFDPNSPVDARLATDADGTFVARDLAADGAWDLLAWHPDYALVVGPAAHGLAEGEQDLPPIRLSDGFVLAGTVSDQQKQPLAGVSIELAFDGLPAQTEAVDAPSGLRLHSVSDATGGFEFLGIGAGSWTLRARLAGHAEAWLRPLTFFEGQAVPDANVTLGPERPVNGVVVSTTGAPVAEAILRLQREPIGAGMEFLARSDAEGRFAFSGVGEGAWQLAVERAGHLPPPPQRIGPGDGAGLRLELTPLGAVHGRAQAVTVRGPFTAEFWLTSRGHPPFRPTGAAAVPIPANDVFTLDAPGPGTFVLLIRAPGCAPAWSPMFQVGPQVCELGTIALEPGASVRGRLLDEAGGPVAGALVRGRAADWRSETASQPFGALLADFTDAPPAETLTGPDGSFLLTDLSPLVGSLSFESPAIATWTQPVLLTLGRESDLGELRVAAAGVIEVIGLRADGEALAGGTVLLQRDESGLGLVTRLLDARGRARLGGLASGDWWVSVVDGGAVFGVSSQRQRVWLAPGSVQQVEIRLESGR